MAQQTQESEGSGLLGVVIGVLLVVIVGYMVLNMRNDGKPDTTIKLPDVNITSPQPEAAPAQ